MGTDAQSPRGDAERSASGSDTDGHATGAGESAPADTGRASAAGKSAPADTGRASAAGKSAPADTGRLTAGAAGRLAGLIALVTGGLGGIGAAVARLFVSEGATVLVTDLAPHGTPPPGATYRPLDVTDESAWQALTGELRRDHGRLDVLVHSAGIAISRPLLDTSAAEFRRVQETNTTATFLAIRAAAPLMPPGGSIVTLSSINGVLGATGLAAYAATKFAVRGLTKVAALELAEAGIRVNTLCPGSIATAITAAPGFADTDMDAYTRTIPLGRRGAAQDVAEAALYLASDASAYVTGTELVVDGGITAGRRFPRR